MTTKKEPTGTQQGKQPPGDDNGVAAAAAAANAPDPTEPTLEDRVKQILGSELDVYGRQVKQTIDQSQGRAQQFWNDKLKEDRGELAEFMGDLTQVLDDDQRQVLDGLREKRQRDSIGRRLDNLEKPPEPAAAAPAAAPTMSEADANALFETVDGLIEASGLDIKPSDAAVWAGYKADMPLSQAQAVARKNIKALRTAAPVASGDKPPAPTPQSRVPASTSGAETVPADTYDSLSDLAAAFRDREINSITFNDIGREKGWLR